MAFQQTESQQRVCISTGVDYNSPLALGTLPPVHFVGKRVEGKHSTANYSTTGGRPESFRLPLRR